MTKFKYDNKYFNTNLQNINVYHGIWSLKIFQQLFNSVIHGGIAPEAEYRSMVVPLLKKHDNTSLKPLTR